MGYNGEIPVTYTNGVLKPDRRLNFPEGTRFRATIRPAGPDPQAAEAAMKILRRISESGAFRSGGRKLTRDQMHERS
jgi:predicted DNA-binding antitoxin AbrB/MazE fold protein